MGYVDESFPLEPFERIADLVTRLVEVFGDSVFSHLPDLLQTSAIAPPNLEPSLPNWLSWIEKEYVPQEPSILSPGAIATAKAVRTYNEGVIVTCYRLLCHA